MKGIIIGGQSGVEEKAVQQTVGCGYQANVRGKQRWYFSH